MQLEEPALPRAGQARGLFLCSSLGLLRGCWAKTPGSLAQFSHPARLLHTANHRIPCKERTHVHTTGHHTSRSCLRLGGHEHVHLRWSPETTWAPPCGASGRGREDVDDDVLYLRALTTCQAHGPARLLSHFILTTNPGGRVLLLFPI